MGSYNTLRVEQLLDVGEDSHLLAQARCRYRDWVEADGRLGVCASLDELFGYLSAAPTEEADRCMLALAMLAAPDGGDDAAAAAVLARALLPGAVVLASRLTSMLARRGWHPTGTTDRAPVSARVDERVASQLWIEVRSFPWRRLTKVGGNILMNTRARVLWDCGDHGQVERFEPTWAACTPVDFWDRSGPVDELHARLTSSAQECDEGTSREVLIDVLAWACAAQVITTADRSLLLMLIDAARVTDELRSTSRGRGNLCSDLLSAMVAPDLGVSPATVRRRAARSIMALAAAAPGRYTSDR